MGCLVTAKIFLSQKCHTAKLAAFLWTSTFNQRLNKRTGNVREHRYALASLEGGFDGSDIRSSRPVPVGEKVDQRVAGVMGTASAFIILAMMVLKSIGLV
jgi:hypothetical protein